MTVQVDYEPINLLANKQPFEQYLSAAPNCMFRLDETTSAFGNPYIDSLRILTDGTESLMRNSFGTNPVSDFQEFCNSP